RAAAKWTPPAPTRRPTPRTAASTSCWPIDDARHRSSNLRPVPFRGIATLKHAARSYPSAGAGDQARSVGAHVPVVGRGAGGFAGADRCVDGRLADLVSEVAAAQEDALGAASLRAGSRDGRLRVGADLARATAQRVARSARG